MGVGMMPMVMAVMFMALMVMAVTVGMLMVVRVDTAHRDWNAIGLTNSGALPFTKSASFRKPLDVVVMT